MNLFDKKANHGDHVDRISDLPSNVIDGILEHLNIRDVVRTSILSRRWRYMWISVPQLEFDEDFFDRVSGLIKSLPKIQRLAMRSWRNEIMCADIIPPTLLINSVSSLEYLKLDAVKLNERGELLYIVSVLQSASKLVELVIESSSHVGTTQVLPDHSEELECSSCCLSQLQTVNIKVKASCQHEMSLIRFILANSPSLETLTFVVFGLGSKQSDAPMLFSISRDLLRMKRASQKAEVEFLLR